MARQKFDINFKEKVLVYVPENSGEQAASHFGIDPKKRRYWRKQKDELRLADKARSALVLGKDS